MQIFTVVIRAHDIRLGSDSRRATAAGRPRRSKCTCRGSLVTHGSPEWRSPDPTPPPSVLGLGGGSYAHLLLPRRGGMDCAALRTIAPGPARAIVSPRRFAARLDVFQQFDAVAPAAQIAA